MRAARVGTAFMREGPTSIFHQQCVTLKLLNAVRHYRIGLPLTLPQLTKLTTPVLLDRSVSQCPSSSCTFVLLRLIQRRLFPLALEVAQFLQLPPAEGKSRVLAHWAIYKVICFVKKNYSNNEFFSGGDLHKRRNGDSSTGELKTWSHAGYLVQRHRGEGDRVREEATCHPAA